MRERPTDLDDSRQEPTVPVVGAEVGACSRCGWGAVGGEVDACSRCGWDAVCTDTATKFAVNLMTLRRDFLHTFC